MMKRKLGLLIFVLLCTIGGFSQVPAFPGAEGHGRYTTGGRGGKTYFVTTLDDNNTGNTSTNEGSLRWCIEKSGARTVVFRISGTIVLNSQLAIKNGNITIAGQSAPGDGICISGYPVSIDADNVIIRYLRFRMGDEKVTVDEAAGADALGSRFHKNIIIDHCSVSWSTDECASFYQNNDFTLQWCIISESLRWSKHEKGTHGYGGIWGGTNASFHHNLLAHHDSRNPRLGPGQYTEPLTETVDMRNNVIYNWSGNACYGGEAMVVNIVNCYYKPGPSTPTGSKRGRIISIDKSKDTTNPASIKRLGIWGHYYIDGNVIGDTDSYSANATADNWTHGVFNQFHSSYGTVSEAEKTEIKSNHPCNPGIVTTHTAETAYEKVMEFVGASLHRDDYDKRIIDETRNRTATFKGLSPKNDGAYPKAGIIDSQNDTKPINAPANWSPWPLLIQYNPIIDINADGIDDNWLLENYPEKIATDITEEGYTILEVYLNSFVADITFAQNKDGQLTSIQKSKVKTESKLNYIQTSETIYIYSNTPIKQVNVFDFVGNKYKPLTIQNDSKQISVSDLKKGIYIFQVLFDGISLPETRKFYITGNLKR